MTDVFKLEHGQKEYENYYNAVKVAKAKAETEEEPITVCRKNLREFEPVVKVHPDGTEERAED